MSLTISYLRFFLAFAVFDQHYGLYGYILRVFHINKILAPDGTLAVRGFLVISGYLIHYILSKKYPSNTLGDFWHFFVSRFLRIYPLFLVVFFCIRVFIKFSILKSIFFGLLIPFGIYEFFQNPFVSVVNMDKLQPPAYAQAWTLSYDAVFYPLGFLFFKSRRFLIISSFLCILGFFVWWVFGDNSLWWPDFYLSFIPNLLAFISGFLAFKINSPSAQKHNILSLLSFLAILYTMYTPFFLSPFLQDIISIISFGILVSELGKNGQSKYEKPIADFTFAFYLIHYPVLFINVPFGIKILISIALAIFFGLLIENKIIENLRYLYIKHVLQTQKASISHITIPKYTYTFSTLFLATAFFVNMYRFFNHFKYPTINPPYTIYFKEGTNSYDFTKTGFWNQENTLTWSDSKVSNICFFIKNPKNIDINMEFDTFVTPFYPQDVNIYFNNSLIYNKTYKTSGPHTLSFHIKSPKHKNCIIFKVPTAVMPALLETSGDYRLLGVGIIKLDIR